MAVSTIDSSGLTSPLTSGVTTNTVTSAAATALTLQSAGTTAVTVDTSQNVGIGTTSPSFKLQVNSTASTDGVYITNSSADGTYIYLNNTSTNGRAFRLISTGAGNGPGSGTLGIYDGTAGLYRTVINADGNLLVNFNSYTGNQAGAPGKIGIKFGSGEYGLRIFNSTGGAANPVQFSNSTAGEVGTINTTNTNTSYNTSSDYRLKNTIVSMTGALAKVVALKPVTYKWNLDDSEGEGFIAHELAEVCPHAVTGEKDAVDADGNPKYQGIDTSYLVATLTAAIQELKSIVDAQAAEIAALKAKVA